MTLLLRLCILLAIASCATALPRYREARSANQIIETCIDDTYTACGGGLPINFCCASGSTCVVSYGSSSSQNTTAICCPDGADCTYIVPMLCNAQMYNVTNYPDSPLLTTDLDDTLESCGSQCCPPGYVCKGDACYLSAKHFEVLASAPTSTIASTSSTSEMPVALTPAPSKTSTSSRRLSSATLSPITSTVSSTAATATSSTTDTASKTTSAETAPSNKTKVIAGVVFGIVVGIAILVVCYCFRQHLLAGCRRFVFWFSSCLPSFWSWRSTRTTSSSVRYSTNETFHVSHLQDPAPDSAPSWWEPVRHQYSRFHLPWRMSHQSPQQSPRESSRTSSSGGLFPRSHNLSTTFTTNLTSAGLPISQYNAHHEPETGIVSSPPSRSAARFAAKQQLKVEKKALKAAKVEKTKKTEKEANSAKKICYRLSSGFYRDKILPPIPQSSSSLLQSDFVETSIQPDVTAVNSLYGFSEQTPAGVLQPIEGSPALTGSKTPKSTQSSDSSHSYFDGGKDIQAGVERVHNTPLLPSPARPPHSQSQRPQRPDPSLYPAPLRLQLPRNSSANGYFNPRAASPTVAHGRAVSDTLPRRQILGVDTYDQYHQRHQRPRISHLPSTSKQPLAGALNSLPSQARAPASAAPPPRPPRPPASAVSQSTRNLLYNPPRRTMTPVELPATPVVAHILAASAPVSPPPRIISDGMPINAFGIISGGGGSEGDFDQRLLPRQRQTLYHELPCFAPVCPYPDASNPISLPPTPPPTRARSQHQTQNHSRSPSYPLHPTHPFHPRCLPALMTDAPPVLPPIPVMSALQARFRSSSPLSAVIHQQQMQQQHPTFSTQSPQSVDVETPMSYHSQSLMSPISPNTPRIEEALAQRLPRMAQARLMEQHSEPSIAIVVHPPPSETPRSTRSSPQIYS